MTNASPSRTFLHCLVFISGLAALSWETLWQIKSTLALGVSAWGTALTLAVTMGGMSAGSLLMGQALKNRAVVRPARIYAGLEWLIGLSGLLMPCAYKAVEALDTWAYAAIPGNGTMIHIMGIAAAIGIPAICMGATLPVLGLMARQLKSSIAVLYGLNTLGAAAGVLLAAFVLIPAFGVTHTARVIATVNIAVGIAAWRFGAGEKISDAPVSIRYEPYLVPSLAALTVFVTGYATFVLEVSWFRSLTAAFRSTTDAFAVMLASVLIALGLGARLATILKMDKALLGTLLSWAGILIFLATPMIERFDLVSRSDILSPAFLVLKWFFMMLYVIGAPMVLIGIALPSILNSQDSARKWGGLYALNAFSAIVGSLSAGWILLPAIGFARSAWLAGILIAGAGLINAKPSKRLVLGGFAIAALLVAVVFESGVGRTRAQGGFHRQDGKSGKVLDSYEGPDVTVSAVEYSNGERVIIVDGFVATQQSLPGETFSSEHYMAWMGHLPMLLHPDPKSALVICFGTGQTANAVRKENPRSLDIIDVNPRIFKLAHHFASNENVLDDSRVSKIVMDGRAYLRRTDKTYDVITLEPMPPNFSGVNALYSKEFYEFTAQRLGPDGVIAQWVPFHIVAPRYSASIAKTFQSVFPNSILWIDPPSKTGILLGSKNKKRDLAKSWPGFARGIRRDLSENEVKAAILLDPEKLGDYAGYGEVVTDDNQLLSYGDAVYQWHRFAHLEEENFDLLERVILETQPRPR